MPRNEPMSPLNEPRSRRDLRQLDFLAQFSKFVPMARGQHCGT
jgi:hypothetical protein